MAEFEAHNLASAGDVLVIAGVAGLSNMGGISAQTGKRQGEAGAIVMGGIRDIAHSRAVGYPLWSSEISPVTGKWRLETVEINGSVQIGEVRVEPGDLVVADDTGVCFIPRDRILDVLELAENKAKAEDLRCKAIDGGIAVPDLSRSTYGEKDK
jgi:regulator of RNase E activity RraA